MADKTTAPTTASAQRALMEEQAVYQFVTWLTRWQDPDMVLKKAGLTRVSLRAVEVDDEVSQCLETRREAVIGTPWRIEPMTGENNAATDFLIDQIGQNYEQFLRGAFQAIPYGYSVIETVYRQDGRAIVIDHLSEKPFEWFDITPDSKLRFQPATGDLIECDPLKFILTRRQPSYAQPYGEPLLSRLYWPVFFRGHGRKFWSKFLERFGEPLLIGKVKDQKKFVTDVLALGLASGLPVQQGDDIQHVAVTQAGEFERYENAMARSIQKLVLGQTLTSEVGDKGSYAAAKVHETVRQDKRNADIRLIAAAFQKQVDALCLLNRLPPHKFVMADDTGLESERAARDKVLADAGILRPTAQYILDRYDFREGDFEMIEPAEPKPPAPGNPGAKDGEDDAGDVKAQAIMLAGRRADFTPQQQAIEEAGTDLLRQVTDPIPIDAMLSAVKAATDPADLAVRLSLLLDHADPRFTELLARAQFAAQTLGYVVAEIETPATQGAGNGGA